MSAYSFALATGQRTPDCLKPSLLFHTGRDGEKRGGGMEEELYLQSSGVAATCPPGLAGSLNICNKMHKHDNKWNVETHEH